MKRKWKQVEVRDHLVVPFDWLDKTPGGGNLGQAEFQVCVRFKKNLRMKEFWVFPVQLRMDVFWHFKGGDNAFRPAAYEELQGEGAWMMTWCKEHDCPSLSIYAPVGANFLMINGYGINFYKNHPYPKEVV